MKPLRIYWAVKGKQNANIGDNIANVFEPGESDYDVLDWNFDFEKMANNIVREFDLKKQLNNGKDMCESNLYICTQSGTIRGIIPINHEN